MSLSPRKKSDHNLSANQFQEKLHTWLRDQGLLSELKSHLRMQMVSALQDGSPSINRQFSISPKIQALTVLIADFFLQQGYNFSLSVLTTEVPFIGQMFTHLSQSAVKEGLENGRLLAERFSARDVEDILETLGMPPGTRMHSEILSLYNNSENKDSLLVCIIRSLTFMNSDKSKVNERNTIQNPDHVEERNQSSASVDEVRNCCEHHAAESPDLWVQEMYRALAHNNFTLSQIDELQNRMRKIHEAEILRVKQEEAAKYSMLIEEKLKRQEEREEFFSEWQEKMRGEIEEKEEKLRVFANELISQHDEVKEKLAKLEAETQTMKEQEKALKEKMERSAKELEEKKSEMELEKADIENAYERLLLIRNKELAEQRAEKEKEREEEERMKEKREEEERSKEVANQLEGMNLIKWLQDQCSGLLQNGAHAQNRVEKEDKGLQTVLPTPENQKKDTQREDDEKAELRERVMRQRRRIEELTTRAADLANQLQDAQLMQPPLQLVNSPTIAAQPTVRLNPRPAWPPHTGSGEETSLSERLPNSVSRSTQASRIAGNVAATNTPAAPALPPESGPNTASATGNYSGAAGNLTRRRTRRIASRSPAAANNHSSDDSTTTEEMIEEARQRLRRLENESSEIHQSYQDFRLRLSQDIPPVLSHPEQDRSRNAFNYRSFSSAGQTMISAGRNMLARTNPRTKTVKLDSMLNIRPTYDLFQPRYSRLHNMIQNVSAWRQRPSDDDWVLDGDEYLDNSQRLFWQRPTLNSQLSTDDSQIIPDRPSFSRHNRSRPVSSLRKKMNDGKYLNPQQVETIAEKLDETSQGGQKETSGMESEGVIESMRNHELLCSEIDEKLSKRKEFLKKTSSSKDGKLREDSESVEKKRKSLTFNRTVAVFENDNEIWYDSKENSEDDDSNERTSLQGHTKLSSIPEQNQMVEDNNNDLQSVSGHSNTSSTSRGGGLKSSTESVGKIIDENTPTMKVNGDVLDVKDVKSTTFSDKIRELSDYGNAEEEELNHNSFTSLRSDRSSIEESQIPKKLSDNDRIVVSENNLLRERSVIRQNSIQNSHPRTRSPSSLVSHFSNNNFGLNSSLSETANPRSPRKLNQSDMSDRVPSFVLPARKNPANSAANQDDDLSSKANYVTSGEPDVLLADLEKRTGTNSVGSGEISVESSKMKNGSNNSVASSLQNRTTVMSPRIATVSAGDPWREPGDGIDFEKIDSDDPVSVGTQDSSSANSFW